MSLVNDALKRAKEAQKKGQPEAPGPQFRPAEPAAPTGQSTGLLIPIVIAVVAIAAAMIVWLVRQKTAARQANVEPKPAAPVAATPVSTPPVQPAPAPAPAPVVAGSPAPAPVVSAPPPQLKLQAIFYTPGHSSAIINGKTVHAGDNFKGFRVAAITQTSATLVSATATNVMTLEQ